MSGELHLVEYKMLCSLGDQMAVVVPSAGAPPALPSPDSDLASALALQRAHGTLRAWYLRAMTEHTRHHWRTPPTGARIPFPGAQGGYAFAYDRQHPPSCLEKRLVGSGQAAGCLLFSSGMGALCSAFQALGFLLGDDGALRAALDPVEGPSTVVLESTVTGPLPRLRLPEIVWRAGIDLAPLDAADERDRRWLRGLVWPGERGRDERIEAALDIAASDPPLLVAGDALEGIEALAAAAPTEATLVITTPGVLVHIPRERRSALVARISALDAHWVTIDPPGALDVWVPPVDTEDWPGFVVAIDGQVRAAADPLGAWWEWRTALPADAS